MKGRPWLKHFRATVRSSTLRLSFAAFLEQELELSFWRDKQNSVRMDHTHEGNQSFWIAKKGFQEIG